MGAESQWIDKIFTLKEPDFEALALEVFRFQYQQNPLYREYVNALAKDADSVTTLLQIPFLPIRFFKSHRVATTSFEPALVFESSGTTGSINSRHYIKDAGLYRESFSRGFRHFFGEPGQFAIIGLLPSYLERNNASLVYMVNELIGQSENSDSGFYLSQTDQLLEVLARREASSQPTLLIGVTFALLDLAEAFQRQGFSLQHTHIMETGGMKGRRKEMIREEVHNILQRAFDVATIYSEYGMTELLSQAYSAGNGIYETVPWMKILLRDEEDPMTIQPVPSQQSINGVINVIDLANIYSCSFIATDDAGRLYPNGQFEVLGRMDGSDLRGCSLMTV